MSFSLLATLNEAYMRQSALWMGPVSLHFRACALGLEDHVGSLQPRREADLIDPNATRLSPSVRAARASPRPCPPAG